MLRLPGGIPIPGAIDRDLSDGFTGHIGADQFPAIPRLTLLFPTIFDFQQESLNTYQFSARLCELSFIEMGMA
ncbi:MAG: hypothetical protein IPL99_12405 [Candidatus Competibacteraceae bacterium]|nr:hypothetical protein [Candidatus Competibacteraceae bacterium]